MENVKPFSVLYNVYNHNLNLKCKELVSIEIFNIERNTRTNIVIYT